MSYKTIKDGIVGILNGIGYSEASVIDSYEDASVQEYGNTFIIQCLEGTQESESETLYGRTYDKQKWNLIIAFDRSNNNDAVNRDIIHIKKDAILTAIENHTNWTSFARMMKYDSWKFDMTDNYFLISLAINVTDVYTY